MSSIDQIAAKLKLSRMTVSRALRGVRGVAPRTRERVRQTAEEMGYRPNPLVAAWMNQVRSNRAPALQSVLAYGIFHPATREVHKDVLHRGYLAGAQAEAERRGFLIEPFWFGEADLSAERMDKILKARGISGLLVHPLFPVRTRLKLRFPESFWHSLSVVSLGYTLTHPNFDRVCFNHFQALVSLVRQLRQQGYSRPALILPEVAESRVNYLWSAAFGSRLAAVSDGKSFPMLIRPRPTKEECFRWLKQCRPDVLIGIDDQVADWLDDFERETKRAIAWAHLDGKYAKSSRAVAAVVQSSEEIGAEAATLLMNQVIQNRRGIPDVAKVVLLEGKVENRENRPKSLR